MKKKSIIVGVRMSDEMKSMLQKIASAEETNESAIVRRILKKNLPKELSRVVSG